MRLGPKEIEEELRKAEEESESEFLADPSPHEQAIDNIIHDIDLEFGNYFPNEYKCSIHGTLTDNRGCRQCQATHRDMQVRVHELGVRYKLDSALFDYDNIEYLINLDEWFTRVQQCWFGNSLAEMYYPEDCMEVEKFRSKLKQAGLTWKFDQQLKCSNTPYELKQIMEKFLEFRNEHEVAIMSEHAVVTSYGMY